MKLDRSLIAWKDRSHGTTALDYDEGNAADAAESENVCDDLSVRLVCSVASELDHYVNGSAEAIAADMDDMMIIVGFNDTEPSVEKEDKTFKLVEDQESVLKRLGSVTRYRLSNN